MRSIDVYNDIVDVKLLLIGDWCKVKLKNLLLVYRSFLLIVKKKEKLIVKSRVEKFVLFIVYSEELIMVLLIREVDVNRNCYYWCIEVFCLLLRKKN